MRRREFITLFGGVAAWPIGTHTQEGAKIPRIGIAKLGGDDLMR